MYLVNKELNNISKIQRCSFKELNIKERPNLQEWIVKNPDCLCDNEDEQDKLLIIQKEFDGFDDTTERLDVLALDKRGRLVIIENKLDDSGKDVTWQALKYVSYCSTLQPNQIKEIYQVYIDKYCEKANAQDKIEEFFDNTPFEEIPLNVEDQRMILVAGTFRKEVTSTVMWMINHGLQVQCFKALPYKLNDQILLDIDQIIPIKEAQDYIISIRDKAVEETKQKASCEGSKERRRKYWSQLLEKYNTIDDNFKNVHPTTDCWLNCGSGVSGCAFSFTITENFVSIDLYISLFDASVNKAIFDDLFAQKEKLESQFGNKIDWQRLNDKKACRICYKNTNYNIKNISEWNKCVDFHCKHMPAFINTFKKPLKEICDKIKNN